jgi:hypothetical protein
VNGSAASALKGLCKGDCSLNIPTIGNRIGRRNPYPDWPIRRKSLMDSLEYLKREAHSVCEAAAVFVLSLIGDQREELVEQIGVGS